MSRIGLSPIKIPTNVSVSVEDGLATFSSANISKVYAFPSYEFNLQQEGGFLTLVPSKQIDTIKASLGLHRSLIKNIIVGLSEGFKKELSIVGVGYKASVNKKYLIVSIGYSHEIYYLIPNGISIEVVRDTIVIKSNDKMLIGSVAMDVCCFRKFDPYKGKGIHLKGGFLLRKQAKKK